MSLLVTLKIVSPRNSSPTEVLVSPSSKKPKDTDLSEKEALKVARHAAKELEKIKETQRQEALRAQFAKKQEMAEKIRNDPHAMQIDEYVALLSNGKPKDCIQITEEGLVVDKDQFSSEQWRELNSFCDERGILVWENWDKDCFV